MGWISALIAASTVLPGLGAGTLWDNSETAYGEVAREVLYFHDPVVMHLNGASWFVQPPLYFWIAALFAKLFGVTAFSLRLPSALATIGIAGGIGYGVARMRGERAALFSALVASTMLMNAIVGRLAIMDAMLDAAIAVAIGGLFAALRGASIAWWYVAWVALGLGVLTKGPVGLVVPALVIVPWALWQQRSEALAVPARIHWLAGAIVLVAIVAPWTIALAAAAGPGSLAELIGHYTFGRYVGTIENQAGPVWYYLPVLVLGAFPWFAFLPPAIASGWASARRRDGDLERLAVVWTVVPFLFFSLAQTKLPNYIALEFPALAVLVGLWFDRLARTHERRAAIAWAMLVPLSLGVLGVAIVIFSANNRLGTGLASLQSLTALLGAIVFAGWAIMLVLLARKSTTAYAPYPLAAAGIAAMMIIALVALPLADSFKPIPPLAAVIRARERGGDSIAIQGVRGGNALLFYTHPRVIAIASPGERPHGDAEDPRNAICAAPRAFVVTSAKRPQPDPTYGRNRRRLAESNGNVLFLYDGPGCAGE
jgi:4-amino-4-deoxy-L-arabinose transferase-like glycosyltransferase